MSIEHILRGAAERQAASLAPSHLQAQASASAHSLPLLPNSSFSQDIPQLQLAWDSTSLGTFKDCPRKYFLSLVMGWQPKRISVHLTFGLLYHGALERYDHARAQGQSHDDATIAAVAYALTQTWDRQFNRPWLSDDPNKNRFTLIRTIVWYLDQFKNDPFETIILANGKPAVELSFRMELEHQAPTGQPYMLCGHLDRLVSFNDATYIVDRKTSKYTLDQNFFLKYSPDNQFSTYCLGAKVVYSQPCRGLIVDAAQVAVTFSRFYRGFVERREDVLDEWYEDLGAWLATAAHYAQIGHWPMNDKACHNYGGCDFRSICSKSPKVRDEWLSKDFTRRAWDPLQVRGDI